MKKFGLAIIGLIVVIAIFSAIGGGGSSTPDKADAASNGTSKSGLDADQGKVNKIVPGKSFQLGDFHVKHGWKITKLGYGMGYGVEGLVVENTTNDDHGFSVNIKLHQGANRILANVSCFAQEAHPDEIVNVDCVPDGKVGKYDYVTIENSF